MSSLNELKKYSLTLAVFLLGSGALFAQYTPEQILEVKPTQSNVAMDVPSASDTPKCKIIEFKEDNMEGVCLTRADGVTPLRVWCAPSGSKNVEQVRFYRNGIEVFRDILGKEARWLGDAGSRRGEVNDKGVVSRWLATTPEETTAEMVEALASGDLARYKRVALSLEDLDRLGVKDPLAAELRKKIVALDKDFAAFIEHAKLPIKVQWGAFNGNHPALLPQGRFGLRQDLPVYYNAGVTLIASDNPNKSRQYYIGDMVRIDGVWKVVGLPDGAPFDSDANEINVMSILFPAQGEQNAPAAASAEMAQSINEAQRLLETATPEEYPARCEKCYSLLLAYAAGNPKEEAGSIIQAADLLFAAVQSGYYPQGVERLSLLNDKYKGNSNADLAAHVRLRLIDGTFYAKTQTKPQPKLGELEKAQAKHTEELAAFAEEYPQTLAGATALMYLALNEEYLQEDDQAGDYYTKVAKHFAHDPLGKKAAGAVARLRSTGKEFTLPKWKYMESGELDLTAYRGKALAIFCWASWTGDDVERMRRVLAQYSDRLAVVGICLDDTPETASAWLKQLKEPLPWKNVYIPGGLNDSVPAMTLGVPNLPMIILLDAEGKVVRPNVMSIDELEARLKGK